MKMKRTDTYKVHSYEIDEYSNASLPAICNYMQESAWNHAEDLGVGFSHLIKKDLVWVMSRQRIKFHRYPRWGQDVVVNTWPSGMDRMYCYRDFKVENQDKEPLVTATSTWFVINVKTRRPQRAESYMNIRPESPERMFDEFAAKLGPAAENGQETSRKVMYSDMDVNGHLNNINYMKYIVDSMPHDFLKNNRMTELEINYLNEALHDDTVIITRQDNNNGEILYSLKRDGSDEVMCRAKTLWEKI